MGSAKTIADRAGLSPKSNIKAVQPPAFRKPQPAASSLLQRASDLSVYHDSVGTDRLSQPGSRPKSAGDRRTGNQSFPIQRKKCRRDVRQHAALSLRNRSCADSGSVLPDAQRSMVPPVKASEISVYRNHETGPRSAAGTGSLVFDRAFL